MPKLKTRANYIKHTYASGNKYWRYGNCHKGFNRHL